MHGFSGRRFPWQMADAARFDPYAVGLAQYAAPAPNPVPRTLADKVEGLVQAAYAQADRQTGRHLAGVLRNLHRRIARLDVQAPGEAGVSFRSVRLPGWPANDP